MLAHGLIPVATICLLTGLVAGCRTNLPNDSDPERESVALRGAPLDADEAAWLLARARASLERGAQFFGDAGADPLVGQRLEIWIVRDPMIWQELRASAGRQHLGPAFFLVTTEPQGERRLRIVLGETPSGALPVDPGALAHELGHALLAARRPQHGPAWLEEGFAEWLRVQSQPERHSQLLARAAANGPWQPDSLMERTLLRADDPTAYARAFALFVELQQACGDRWPQLVLQLQPGPAAQQRSAIEAHER